MRRPRHRREGFVGRNLCFALKNIRDGKDRRAKYQQLLPLEVMEYDVDSAPGELEDYCSRADFVFNLAGVNRPKEQSEFMEGNFGFASTLLDTLERHGNTCPVMPLQLRAGEPVGPLRGFRIRRVQARGGGPVPGVFGAHGGTGTYLPLPPTSTA